MAKAKDGKPESGASKPGDESHSVSSKTLGTPKMVSFQIPNMSDWRQHAARARRAGIGFIVGVVVLAGLAGYGGSWLQNHNNTGLITGTVGSEKKIVTSQSQLISQIAKTVGPSVVSVNVDISSSGTGNSGGGFGLYGFSQPEQEQAAGTGIIISSDGLIVTNRHVVPAGTTSVSVTLSDGTELKNVSVVGRTSDSDTLDVAFLKINNSEGHKLPPATLGDSSTVQVGDDVVAIGNALGQFQNTVTSGIISGYGRSVQAGDSSGNGASAESLVDLFQTDAAINEGNSGGPLVNLNGQVIGINTAIAGNAQNIGFAIPINDVKGLIDQVVKTGKFSRPYLGVEYVQLTADIADEFNLKVQSGAFIAPSNNPSNPSVIAGSPAAQAGLQTNDVITQVNGMNIDQTHSLTALLDQHQPGDTVNLTVLRAGKTMHVSVTLGTAPTS